ncbi:MAG: hypothetical protein IJ497_10525 [Clostridia bacterium]|nr:hypothetical protein [Clostridia bacterium]
MNRTGQKPKTDHTQKKRAEYERLWLTYYNDTLYAKGIITEEQRNRMRIRIVNRSAAAGR